MGAWGTGIFDNDTTCDIRDQFNELIEEGLSVEDVTQTILDENTDDEDLEELSLVYIGLSVAQLDTKCLLEEVRKMTIELIERGADLELWDEGEEKSDLEERKQILNELKQKLINYKE